MAKLVFFVFFLFFCIPSRGSCQRKYTEKYNKAGDKRVGRVKHKIVGNKDNRISVEGRGTGRGTKG